jgi:hypothetical protein
MDVSWSLLGQEDGRDETYNEWCHSVFTILRPTGLSLFSLLVESQQGGSVLQREP